MNEKNAGRLMDSLGKTADSWFEQENIKAEYMMLWKAHIYVDIDMFFQMFRHWIWTDTHGEGCRSKFQDKVFEVKGCL